MDLIRIRRREGRAFRVSVRDRTVVCDMALADGGRGVEFSPVELLGGSLGACIAMAVQSWCDACGHGGDVGVDLTVELQPDPVRIGVLVVDVELPAGVPEDRCAAVRRVVEHCVIHETLRNPPRVDLEVSAGT